MSESHDSTGLPQNPDVRFEATDVDSRAVLRFGIILAVSLAAIMGALWGLFVLFYDQEAADKQSAYPLAVESRQGKTEDNRLPPTGPLIEGFPLSDPQHTLGRFGPPTVQKKFAEDAAWLARYEWLTADHQAARIPITEAMKRVLAMLPIAKNAPASARPEWRDLPSVSSSGREPIGGPP